MAASGRIPVSCGHCEVFTDGRGDEMIGRSGGIPLVVEERGRRKAVAAGNMVLGLGLGRDVVRFGFGFRDSEVLGFG